MEKGLLEASKRWKEEGKKFKDGLNDWLDVMYVQKEDPTTECPEETREDMIDYVLNKIGEFNSEGKYAELR